MLDYYFCSKKNENINRKKTFIYSLIDSKKIHEKSALYDILNRLKRQKGQLKNSIVKTVFTDDNLLGVYGELYLIDYFSSENKSRVLMISRLDYGRTVLTTGTHLACQLNRIQIKEKETFDSFVKKLIKRDYESLQTGVVKRKCDGTLLDISKHLQTLILK